MITLENKELEVGISEGRGARIESFRDKRTGKDWVWKPERSKDNGKESLGLDEGFDDYWAGGWEEVFPNDAPSEVESFRLIDHGEVWRRSWVKGHADRRSVSFRVDCETYPVSLEKTFRLDEKESLLMIDYILKSRASKTLPYIFKLHPALLIEPGDEFRMPESQMEPVALGFSRILQEEKKTPYPVGKLKDGTEVKIDKAREDDRHTREFVRLSGLSEGECSIFNPTTRSKLSFSFPVEKLPYVWLFQSYGGFNGHYVAMAEPTNAGHYDLAVAMNQGLCGQIRPEEEIKFSISVRIERDS